MKGYYDLSILVKLKIGNVKLIVLSYFFIVNIFFNLKI